MMNSQQKPLIEMNNVTRVYGKEPTLLAPNAKLVHALKGIDLSIYAGERFGIVGESGSGKSTLIRLIAGLDQPTSGSITFGDQRVDGKPEKKLGFLRKELQFVFQDPMASLDPRMRIRDIIREPLLGNHDIDHATRVTELLEAVGLPASAADRFPHQFSGGQRQRISIARALASRPSLLIADEPVSALDVSVRAQILNLLSDLVEEFNLTLVFVSHDLSVVKYLCDRVAVLYHGDLVEVGTTEEVYSESAQGYTKGLISATPTLNDALSGIDASQLIKRL